MEAAAAAAARELQETVEDSMRDMRETQAFRQARPLIQFAVRDAPLHGLCINWLRQFFGKVVHGSIDDCIAHCPPMHMRPQPPQTGMPGFLSQCHDLKSESMHGPWFMLVGCPPPPLEGSRPAPAWLSQLSQGSVLRINGHA